MSPPSATPDPRAAALALACRAFRRWHPAVAADLELEVVSASRSALRGQPPVHRFEVVAWRRREEVQLELDPETDEVLSFVDPEGRRGAEKLSGDPPVDREAADEAVGASGQLPFAARLVEARLEPVVEGGGPVWRLEYERGAPVRVRFEVHPVTGAIVGYFRLDRAKRQPAGIEGAKP